MSNGLKIILKNNHNFRLIDESADVSLKQRLCRCVHLCNKKPGNVSYPPANSKGRIKEARHWNFVLATQANLLVSLLFVQNLTNQLTSPNFSGKGESASGISIGVSGIGRIHANEGKFCNSNCVYSLSTLAGLWQRFFFCLNDGSSLHFP